MENNANKILILHIYLDKYNYNTNLHFFSFIQEEFQRKKEFKLVIFLKAITFFYIIDSIYDYMLYNALFGSQ